MTITNDNKSSRNQNLRLIIGGVEKHFTNASLVLAGQTFTAAQLIQFFQQDIDASDAADKARATWLQLVQAQEDSREKTAPVLRALKGQVFAQFGESQGASATLADFGYSPRKVAQKTTVTKAEAAGKSLATREARHTMGKNQKKSVKGTVATSTTAPSPTNPTPLPSVSPASLTSAPAPAPTTPAPSVAAPVAKPG